MKDKRNRGQVLVLVALAMFVLLGFAALGIDVGFMYSVRHELQRSADAGALAGASAFTEGDWNDTSMASDHPRGIADARARIFASKDKVIQTPLEPAAEVAVAFPTFDHIEVITSRNASLFFGRIFGMSDTLITARAVARAAVAGPPNVNCVKPFAIPYPWLDDPAYGTDRQGNPDGLYEGSPDPGETVYKDCAGGVGLCFGTRLTIKVGSPSTDNSSPSGQQTSGHFFLMQGNVGGETFQGAADLRYYISEGCFDIDTSKPVDLMTGNAMGPTVQGIEALIARDAGSTWKSGDGPYGAPSSNDFPYDPVSGTHLASPRVVRVVVYDPSVPIVGGGNGGVSGTNASVPVGYDLHGFWIEAVGRQGNDGYVIGRYIPASAFASAGTPTGPLSGTEVKVISLVE